MYSRISRSKIFDHYLKRICNLTQQYGIYTIEIKSPSKLHARYLLQTDDVDIELSKLSQNTYIIYNIKTHKERIRYSLTMYLQ